MAKSKLIKESKGDRIFNVVNFICVTLFMLLVLYPLIYILSCSFSDPHLVASGQVWLYPKGFNVEGYARVFQDENIMVGYANTIFYTVVGTLLNLLLTLPAGYALSKKFPGRNIIMTIFFITMYFGGGMIPTYLLIRDLHLFNTRLVLLLMGAISVYNVIIARTFFAGTPKELEEAAIIDGASTLRTFVQIVLPISKALIGVLTLYYAVGHWNSYFNAMIYIRDDIKKPLQLFLRSILINEQMSSAMADTASDPEAMAEAERLKQLLKYSVIIVSSLPLLIVYPFLQKYFDKGVLIGSIKG
jgi:putative aldouronate transport system permease protein